MAPPESPADRLLERASAGLSGRRPAGRETTGNDGCGMIATQRPDPSECAPYYRQYVELVPEGNIIDILETQLADTLLMLGDLPESRAGFRYEEGKWSLKEVLGHLVDSERIFAARALSFSRGETQPLPGFEQDDYVARGEFDARPLKSILGEYESLRLANLAFFQSFNDAMLLRAGTANGTPFTVRSVLFVLAGHELHHLKVIRERYL
jgi:uncharacterized damage-inducible protein DinB